MRLLIRVLLLLFLFVPCLPGCSEPVRYGQVVDKEFEPAHIDTQLYYDMINEKWSTMDVQIPDKWFVTLLSVVPDDNYQYRSTVWSVTEFQYRQIVIGEYYLVGQQYSRKELNTEWSIQ